MARYFSRTISGSILPTPPIGPLTGGQLMRGDRALAVHVAQDRVVALARRVLCHQTLQGSSWLVPNTDPDDEAPATRTYPDDSTWRTTARVDCELTPGCFPRFTVLASPSGQTQVDDGASGFDAGGAFGRVRVSLTWTDADGGTDTTTTEISIPASTQQYAGSRTDAGAGWEDSFVARSELIYPDGTLLDMTVLRQWTRPPITITGTIDHLGGARPVDVCLYEQPLAQAMEADDDGGEWVSHVWVTNPQLVMPPSWPEQHKVDPTDGDPRGIHHLLDVHHAQAARLGPMLFSWNAWNESTADPTAIAEGYAETTVTTVRHLCDANITAWSSDAPGWSMSSGAYARNQSDNGEWVYRDGAGNARTGAVPVIVRVNSHNESGNTGVLRLQTSEHNWIDCALTRTGVPGWDSYYGWLECGLGPEQQVVVSPYFWSDNDTKWTRVRYLHVYVCRQEPAA
jgi:hypothetical protein